jgi:predicted nucleic acid-binding protein
LLGDRVSRRTAWEIACQSGGSIFDAEYVAIAKLQADALVTADSGLASMAAGIVPMAALTDLLAE